jgi:histidinol-phosphate aminotransferase
VKPSDLAKPFVQSYPSYEPGRPIEDVARELGLDPGGHHQARLERERVRPVAKGGRGGQARDRAGPALSRRGLLRAARSGWPEAHGLAPEQFVIGNGSNEVIELLGHVFLGPGDEVVMGKPEFVVYRLVALLFGATAGRGAARQLQERPRALARAVTPRTKMVIVSTPNNPTGTANTEAELLGFIRSLPGRVICVVDEAYSRLRGARPTSAR